MRVEPRLTLLAFLVGAATVTACSARHDDSMRTQASSDCVSASQGNDYSRAQSTCRLAIAADGQQIRTVTSADAAYHMIRFDQARASLNLAMANMMLANDPMPETKRRTMMLDAKAASEACLSYADDSLASTGGANDSITHTLTQRTRTLCDEVNRTLIGVIARKYSAGGRK